MGLMEKKEKTTKDFINFMQLLLLCLRASTRCLWETRISPLGGEKGGQKWLTMHKIK